MLKSKFLTNAHRFIFYVIFNQSISGDIVKPYLAANLAAILVFKDNLGLYIIFKLTYMDLGYYFTYI